MESGKGKSCIAIEWRKQWKGILWQWNKMILKGKYNEKKPIPEEKEV